MKKYETNNIPYKIWRNKIGIITEPRNKSYYQNYFFEDFRKTPERIYNKCRQYDTVVLLANGNINVNYTYDEAIGIL